MRLDAPAGSRYGSDVARKLALFENLTEVTS
jgi:hypothetical protein